MVKLLDRLPSGSRIAVIRLRSLGDCVLTTPALFLLKRHRPDLKISVIVEPRFAEIWGRNWGLSVEARVNWDQTTWKSTAADLEFHCRVGTEIFEAGEGPANKQKKSRSSAFA